VPDPTPPDAPRPSATATTPLGDKARTLVERLLAKADGRALGVSVARIVALAQSEQAGLGGLAEALLADPYIAARIVRLANSVLYNRTGERVASLPAAITMVGVERVRLIALSAMLLEEFAGHRQRAQLRRELARALYASLLALELAALRLQREAQEEAALATLLRSSGRLLCSAYAFELRERVDELVIGEGCSEARAAQRVLGIDFEALSGHLLRAWGMSERLAAAMLPCPELVYASADLGRNVRMISECSDHAAAALLADSPVRRLLGLQTVLRRFGGALDISPTRLVDALREADLRAGESGDVLGLRGGLEAGQWIVDQLDSRAPAAGRPAGDADGPPSTGEIDRFTAAPPGSSTSAEADASARNAVATLAATIRRQLAAHRVVVAFAGTDGGTLRLVHLDGAPLLAGRALFRVGVGRAGASCAGDLFAMVLTRGDDAYIRDRTVGHVPQAIPAWFRATCGDAHGFVVAPLREGTITVGFVYADQLRGAPVWSDEALAFVRSLEPALLRARREAGRS
jgi:HD-like signal output (HDOD) protein